MVLVGNGAGGGDVDEGVLGEWVGWGEGVHAHEDGEGVFSSERGEGVEEVRGN